MPRRRDLGVCFVPHGPSSGAVAIRRSIPNSRIVQRNRLLQVTHRYGKVVNWGNSSGIFPDSALNQPDAVAKAVDKVLFAEYTARKEWALPSTTYRATAESWLESDPGCKVVCRTLTCNRGGEGIVIARNIEQLVDAPLYTLYIKKRAEFRAHVMNGELVVLQQKRLRAGARDLPGYNPLVRNHSGGWVYCVDNVDHDDVGEYERSQVVDAVKTIGLDFGAVDFIISHDGDLYVLEVNTAPGIESPSVLFAYTRYFSQGL